MERDREFVLEVLTEAPGHRASVRDITTKTMEAKRSLSDVIDTLMALKSEGIVNSHAVGTQTIFELVEHPRKNH